MSNKGTKYHIALDRQGYILSGTPTKPQRQMTQQPIFGNRFASGDRDYSDFSLFWFLAQTDWSGGIKDEKKWRDDAHYYYSSNIDAFSEFGSVKLGQAVVQETGDVDYLTTGVYGRAELATGTTQNEYAVGDTNAKIWVKSSPTNSWTELISLDNTEKAFITQVLFHKNKMFFTTVSKKTSGPAVTNTISSRFQSATTDHTATITTASGWGGNAVHLAWAMAEIGDSLYVSAGRNVANNLAGIFYTDDAGANWSKLVDKSGKNFIGDMIGYNGNLYYLMDTNAGNGGLELRYYDLTNSVDVLVRKFPSGRLPYLYVSDGDNNETLAVGTGGKFMFLNPKNGNLVFCVPLTAKSDSNQRGEVWEYNATTGAITKVWFTDETKRNLSYGDDKVGYIGNGGTIYKNRIHFGNLIYDGEYFFNGIKSVNDNDGSITSGLFSDDNYIWYITSGTTTSQRVKRIDLTNYKNTEDANWIILNEIEEVSTIDKLADEITIVFDTFDVAEEIKVYYSIDGGTTYTLLGRASYTLDGATTTTKTFKFPTNIIWQKMMIKIHLNGDGSSTPVLHDLSLKYLPLPNYSLVWNLQVKCIDNMKLLDKVSKEPKRGIDLRNVLKNAWLTNRVIQFEDIDYVETKLSSAVTSSDTTIPVYSTAGFPEQGTFQIDNEIIKYTSKNDDYFLNCIRGFRGSLADTHPINQIVSNIKNVLIYKYTEQNPVINDNDKDEFIIDLQLLEMSGGSGTTTSTTTTSSSTTTTSSSTTTTSSSTTTTSSSSTTTVT